MNKYSILLKQIEGIVDPKLPLYSNLSNASAILNQMEDINWCGFYIAQDDALYLGPFQGEVACTKIVFGKGVCGTAAKNKESVLIDDVNKFAGHIACSSKSKSEIVVPIIVNGEVKAVIDIDAPIYSRFGIEEKSFLEEASKLLAKLF